MISRNTKVSNRDASEQKIGTFNSTAVSIETDCSCVTEIIIENIVVALPEVIGMQVVSLSIFGDKSMFFRTRILQSLDTLLDQSGTQFFYQCYIQGSIDFVYGLCGLDNISVGVERPIQGHECHVPLLKSFSNEEAMPFLNVNFIDGDQWLRIEFLSPLNYANFIFVPTAAIRLC